MPSTDPPSDQPADGPREQALAGRTAYVLSVSNRASTGVYDDTTGPLITAALEDLGFGTVVSSVVPDGEPVRAALEKAVADEAAVVVTTGGTGISPTDRTPEMTRQVVDREVPGIAEAIRAFGVGNGVPTAALSRGIAGQAARSLVVNLPGSTGGVRDGLAVLLPLLPHALDQIAGGDHPRAAHGGLGRAGSRHRSPDEGSRH